MLSMLLSAMWGIAAHDGLGSRCANLAPGTAPSLTPRILTGDSPPPAPHCSRGSMATMPTSMYWPPCVWWQWTASTLPVDFKVAKAPLRIGSSS